MGSVTRRTLLFSAIGILGTAKYVMATADAEVLFTGTFAATDQEAQEGYFGFGNELAVVCRPESTAHQQMRRFVGKDVAWVIREI